MKDQHFKAALECVGDPAGQIKRGVEHARHDLAVKLVDEWLITVTAKKAEHDDWLRQVADKA